jgi:hypothetical protein
MRFLARPRQPLGDDAEHVETERHPKVATHHLDVIERCRVALADATLPVDDTVGAGIYGCYRHRRHPMHH